MGELFIWCSPLGWKEVFYFLSREGDGWWSTCRSQVGYWDDALPPPCKEKLSGVNGNGGESAVLHHITQLLWERENVWEGFMYWVYILSLYIEYMLAALHNLWQSPSSKDIYLLHGKITTRSVIRPCIFKVSCCNILGVKLFFILEHPLLLKIDKSAAWQREALGFWFYELTGQHPTWSC